MAFGGKRDGVLRRAFEASVEGHGLLAAVGHDLDIAHDDIGARRRSAHFRKERELELADALSLDGELRAADASRFHRDCLFAPSLPPS